MKKSKLIKSVLIYTLVMVMIGLLNTIVFAKDNNKHQNTKYTTYVVKKGDCLSVIADRVKGDKRLENVIAEIQYQNNIDKEITAGRTIIIPVYNK